MSMIINGVCQFRLLKNLTVSIKGQNLSIQKLFYP